MADESILGFTGAFVDPVTAAYPLGDGYRWFLPSLMRFNAPDDFSPFGAGGINPYAYCAGDPVNYSDPSAHVGEEWSALPGVSHLIESSIRQEWERKKEETSGMGLSAYQETKSNHSGGLFAFNPYHEESSWHEKYTKRSVETPPANKPSVDDFIRKADSQGSYSKNRLHYFVPTQRAYRVTKLLMDEGLNFWDLQDAENRSAVAEKFGWASEGAMSQSMTKIEINPAKYNDEVHKRMVEIFGVPRIQV